MTRPTLAVTVFLVGLAMPGCRAPPPETTPDPAPVTDPIALEPNPAQRVARLRDDCGGWEPAADLLDDASALGDAARKDATLAALDAGPLARKIDVLRAGLRLRDDGAAQACAARLMWKWIDGWECARCVDLLRADVLRPGSEADFDEFRSYLGTADLPAFVESLPPLPWNYDPVEMVGHLHRILHEDSLDAWTQLAHHPDEAVGRSANSDWWATVAVRCDRRREEALLLDRPAGTTFPPSPAYGLSAALVDELTRLYVDDAADEQWVKIDFWLRRWCLASQPGPQDEPLLVEIARRCGADYLQTAGGVATVLLGRLHGAESDVFLRWQAADDDESIAWFALALRGHADAVERLVAWSADDPYEDEVPLAALLDADPVRGRAVVEERVLGADAELALETLAQLAACVTPGWTSAALAFDVSRVSWAGFEERALAADIPALRRATIGLVVPGCRTRAMAEAACRDLDGSFFTTEYPSPSGVSHAAREDPEAFLEVGAPESFRAALRRVAASPDETERLSALKVLLAIGDVPSGVRLLELTKDDPFRQVQWDLGRSASPEVLEWLRESVRENGYSPAYPGLAQALGAPEELAWPEKDPPAAVPEALLAGDWRTAFHALLAAAPDEEHGDVAVLGDDPIVRAYLDRLRVRRDLGHYWYATGQLAVLGEPSARTEFWRAMTDGRYRILNSEDAFAKTLGRNLEATMPYWLEQLRANCCRVVTSRGEPWAHFFGVEAFSVPWRTPYDSAKEIWEAGTGPAGVGFVWSRVRDGYVLGVR